tara:strand:+ start:2265 stop:2573 length:309 start_codon:yes stop_codon:yes gene_type:complete
MNESPQKSVPSGESLLQFFNSVFEIRSDLQDIKNDLQEIKGIKSSKSGPEYLPVKEFMSAISIGRTKFDELVADGKVRTVRPNGSRKLYVPASEVTRYFEGE